MSRTAARFTQADARRIIAAAAQARVPVAVEFLPDGTIRALVNSGEVVDMLERKAKEASEEEKGLDL